LAQAALFNHINQPQKTSNILQEQEYSSPDWKKWKSYFLGKALFLRGEVDQAWEQYNHVLQYDSFHVDALLGKIEIFLLRSQLEEAEKHLHLVLIVDPQNFTAQYQLALCKIYQKEIVQALPHLKQAQRLNPYAEEVYLATLQCYRIMGDYRAGIVFAEQLIERTTPSGSAIYQHLITLYLLDKQREKAEKILHQLFEQSNNAETLPYLIQTWYTLNSDSNAQKCLDALAKIDSQSPIVPVFQALLLGLENPKAAIIALDTLLLEQPKNILLLENLVFLCVKSTNFNAAQKYITKAQILDPQNISIQVSSLLMLWKQTAEPKWLQLLQKIAEEPNVPFAIQHQIQMIHEPSL